jgi:hypothetical protein
VAFAIKAARDERYQTIRDLLLDLKALKQDLEFTAKLERSVPPRAEARVHSSIEADFVSQIKQPKSGAGVALSVLLVAAIGPARLG